MVVSSFRSQSTTDVLNFILIHKTQIRRQVARHAWLEFGDYQNEIALCVIEKGHKFDPSRGSFEHFVFGHVEKRLRRIFDDALSHSNSIDDDSDCGLLFRASAESVTVADASDGGICANQATEVVPGAGDLASLANAISTLSAAEIGLRMGITKRAVNMKLARAKASAKHQCSLFDFDREAI